MAATSNASSGRHTRPAILVAMLLLVYTFNWVDRQIFGILAPSIKTDLGLDDTQLGLLGGLAFALLYSTLAIPLAWLADRTSRTWTITISLAVWSLFTAACGFATGFASLFAARIGVGIGEAGGVAPSYALISDSVPIERRARALSVYSLGIPLGSAAGVLLGARIAATVDWRMAFIAVGLAGALLAPIFRLIVCEKPRAHVAVSGTREGASAMSVILRAPCFWLLSLGAAIGSMLGYGYAFWLPSMIERSFGLDLLATSYVIGAMLLVGGVLGIYFGGLLADRLGGLDRGAYARVPAIAFLAAIPIFAGALLVGSPWTGLPLLIAYQGISLMWIGPLITAIQQIVPPHMRATASASFLLVNTLLGLTGGSFLIGTVSDALTPAFGAQALRYAMLGCLPLYLAAAFLMLAASRRLSRDWID